MKKILLLLGLALVAQFGYSQEVLFVNPPAASSGAYDITWADNWGQTPDLSNPANNVTGELVIATDGEENDPNSTNDLHDACEDLVNADEIDGKIAIVYRGLCEFGSKALRCQEAGAIALIIINRDNEVIGMGGGADGGSITIPVIMITSVAGSIITDDILAGNTVTATIGTFVGLFESNVGLLKGDNILLPYGAHRFGSASLGQDVFVGTWVRNFGTAAQDVSVNATITAGDNPTPIYDETSDVTNIAPGDSAFFALPDYTDGFDNESMYTLNYDIQLDGDEFTFDNSSSFSLDVNQTNVLYARVGDNSLPAAVSGTRPAAGFTSYSQCAVYREANADLSRGEGVYFSASVDGGNLTEEIISASLYEWNDDFVDLADANFAMDDINEVASAVYEFTENLPNQFIYIPFDEPYPLQNDVRYLFCVNSTTPDIRLGYDDGINYDLTANNYLQPTTAIEVDGAWSLGFTGGGVQTVTAKVADIDASVSENTTEAIEIEAYPNPTKDVINIPMNDANKVVAIDVYDVTGKLVLSQTVKQEFSRILEMEVTSLENGLYSFKAIFENGQNSTFSVVVNK